MPFRPLTPKMGRTLYIVSDSTLKLGAGNKTSAHYTQTFKSALDATALNHYVKTEVAVMAGAASKQILAKVNEWVKKDTGDTNPNDMEHVDLIVVHMWSDVVRKDHRLCPISNADAEANEELVDNLRRWPLRGGDFSG